MLSFQELPIFLAVTGNARTSIARSFDVRKRRPSVTTRGLWCSGITSALHAEGLGFEPRQVHGILFLTQEQDLVLRNDQPSMGVEPMTFSLQG